MTRVDTILGLALMAVALIILAAMVFWSRSIINRIARKRLSTARDIMRDLKNGE